MESIRCFNLISFLFVENQRGSLVALGCSFRRNEGAVAGGGAVLVLTQETLVGSGVADLPVHAAILLNVRFDANKGHCDANYCGGGAVSIEPLLSFRMASLIIENDEISDERRATGKDTLSELTTLTTSMAESQIMAEVDECIISANKQLNASSSVVNCVSKLLFAFSGFGDLVLEPKQIRTPFLWFQRDTTYERNTLLCGSASENCGGGSAALIGARLLPTLLSSYRVTYSSSTVVFTKGARRNPNGGGALFLLTIKKCKSPQYPLWSARHIAHFALISFVFVLLDFHTDSQR